MSANAEEIGKVEDGGIYVKLNEDKRIVIPSGYKGYSEVDEREQPNWLPIIESIIGDNALSNGFLSLEDGLSKITIDTENAIQSIVSNIDDIENEEQGKALLQYLASEETIETDDDGEHIDIEDGSIKLFDGEIDDIVRNGDADRIYNAHATLNATIKSLDDYLAQADEISDTMEELRNDTEYEKLFDAKEKLENAKEDLRNLGDSEGITDFEDLSETEKQRANILGNKIATYKYVEAIDFELAENITGVDYDEYHDYLSDLKAALEVTNNRIMNMAAQIKAGEAVDMPDELVQNLNEVLGLFNENAAEIDTLQTITSERSVGASAIQSLKSAEQDTDTEVNPEARNMDGFEDTLE